MQQLFGQLSWICCAVAQVAWMMRTKLITIFHMISVITKTQQSNADQATIVSAGVCCVRVLCAVCMLECCVWPGLWTALLISIDLSASCTCHLALLAGGEA
jgi:hypothetical protein